MTVVRPQSLDAASGRCDAGWRESLFSGAYRSNREWWSDNLAWQEGWPLNASAPPVYERRCERAGGWRVLRIGPFASRGAGTKHAIGMENVVAAGECVAASLLSPVTEAGELVGEPPIGVHHVHVLSHTSIMQDVKAWGFPLLDRHGRRFHYHPQWADHRHGGQCDAARGGVACMNRSYPAGYGQRYTEAAHVDLELVEAPAESLQVPPRFWWEMSFQACPPPAAAQPAAAEVAFRETSGSLPKEGRPEAARGEGSAAQPPAPLRYLAPYVWASPFDMRLCALFGTCPLNFTFHVPENATSALWYSVRHRKGGRLLSFDLHTHEHLVTAFIFSGRPESVGLNSGGWRLSQPWLPLAVPPASLPGSIAEFGGKVAAASPTACTYQPTVEVVSGARFVRRGYPRCNGTAGSSFAVAEGEYTTVLGFFDTRPSASLPKRVEYFQHLSLMGLWTLDSGMPPPLDARLGADQPVWDEPRGELRDWDVFRGFVAGGLGVTSEHAPAVTLACAAAIAAGAAFFYLVAVACRLAASPARGRARRARRQYVAVAGAAPVAPPAAPAAAAATAVLMLPLPAAPVCSAAYEG